MVIKPQTFWLSPGYLEEQSVSAVEGLPWGCGKASWAWLFPPQLSLSSQAAAWGFVGVALEDVLQTWPHPDRKTSGQGGLACGR